MKHLPQMHQARGYHGCGQYINDNDDMARWSSIITVLLISLQVFLVTGGKTSSGNIASTEVLVHGDSSWSYVGDLPVPTRGLRGVSVNNKVIMTGTGPNID